MSKRRGYREDSVKARGENSWRIRYRIRGERFTRTVHGSKHEALKVLRDLLHSGDTGKHVPPDKMKLADWIEHWLSIGCPGKRRNAIGSRAQERYAQLLRRHVVPTSGDRPLQALQSTEIDNLYSRLAETMAAPTLRYVHVVLSSCLATAVRTSKIAVNPMTQLAKVPANKPEHTVAVLEADRLRELVKGFKGSSLHLIVAVAALTGARRGEILALQPISTSKKVVTRRARR